MTEKTRMPKTNSIIKTKQSLSLTHY